MQGQQRMGFVRRKWKAWGVLMLVGLMAAMVLALPLLGPDSPSKLLARAQADFQAGRFDSAAATLDRLATLREPTPMDRLARAEVARGLGHIDEALSSLASISHDGRPDRVEARQDSSCGSFLPCRLGGRTG
jgi:hypothetical protein